MRTTGSRIAWVGVMGLVLGGTAFGAVVPRDVGELTVEARQIVLGDVVEVTSFWDDRHELIQSRIVVAVDEYLVGDGPGTEVLEMSGGTVDDVTLRVSVLPVFEVGDHVLLFLGDSEIRLVQSFQGAYLTDGVQAVRMAPACRRVVEESLEPLGDVLGAIEQALPTGTKLPEIKPYQGDFVLPLGGLRYGLCGYSWAYQANPMGENYVINGNCVDASAGDAASQRTQIQNGAAAWNSAGADFVFTYGGTSTQTDVANNGTNLVYFDTTPPGGGGYVAATYIWYSGGNISECDLVFNDQSYAWWNGSGGCSSMMDIWDVATHELGHFLCLADLYDGGDSAKTMYGYVSYCETLKRTLDTDDINGIIAIYGSGGPDTTPPTPNPMTFATPPYPTATSSIAMTATTATDATPPVQYFFDFVSGGTGGTDSAWQSSTGYSDAGLTANTSYTYRVKARDSAPTPNETSYSSNSATATYIETPTGVTFGTETLNSIPLNAAGTLTNLTTGTSGVYFDSTTTGGDGGINAWIQTTSDTATGLTANTLYAFRAKARNQNSVETAYCPENSKPTLIETPTGVSFGTVALNSIVLNATGTLTNLTTGTSGAYFDSTTTGGDGGINAWVQATTDTATGLTPNTLYNFRAKARNQSSVETAYTTESGQATLIETPTGVTFGTATLNSIVLNATGTLTNLTVGSSGVYFDSTTTGGDGGINAWVQTPTDTATGLTANTLYAFRAKARNQNLAETAYTSESNQATLIQTPTGVTFGTVTNNSIVLNATGTLTNLTVGSSGVYFDSATVGGDGGINAWVQTPTDTATGLGPNVLYTFQVKARNQSGVETAYSATNSKATLANVPAAPTLSPFDCNSMDLSLAADGNPAITTYSIQCTATSPNDPDWNGKYVSAAGIPAAAAEWRTAAQWGTTRLTGMQSQTNYTFRVTARNQELVPTAQGPAASLTTSLCGDGDMDGDLDVDLYDFALWQQCFGTAPLGPGCAPGDFDGGGVINLVDYAQFNTRLNGPV